MEKDNIMKYVKKFVFYILLYVAISIVSQMIRPYIVKAEVYDFNDMAPGWALNDYVKKPTRAYILSLNGSGSYDDITFGTFERYGYPLYVNNEGSTSLTYGNNGIYTTFLTDVPFKAKYLYSANIYLCGPNLPTDKSNWQILTGPDISFYSDYVSFSSMQYQTWKTISDIPYEISRSHCYSYSSIFVSNSAGTYLGIRQQGTGKKIGTTHTLVGYSLEPLGDTTGLTEADIKKAISSSGLASASSVSQVQSSVNALKTEVNNMQKEQQETNDKLDDVNKNQQETNQKLDEVNSSITSEESPNLGGLENSSGWLPAGPVDSILNLPLSLLNNVTTNLGKSCQPVVLNLPYVNEDITLPCINTFYENIGISNWLNTIGIIASAFILFTYFMSLYKWVDDTLSFRENNYIDNWGGV